MLLIVSIFHKFYWPLHFFPVSSFCISLFSTQQSKKKKREGKNDGVGTFFFLCAEEEELCGVLARVRMGYRVGAAKLPVLCLQRLNQTEKDQTPTKLVAVALAQVDVPMLGIFLRRKLREFAVIAERSCGYGREALLQLVNGLLAQCGAHEFENRGVEGDVRNKIGHLSLLLTKSVPPF